MPSVKLVINYDVPMLQGNQPDYETYLHRIGRTGRLGQTGFALTLLDNDEEKANFSQIMDHYEQWGKVKSSEGGAEELVQIIQKEIKNQKQ